MYEEVLNNVIKIFKNVLDNNNIDIDAETNIINIGINSLSFMNMVVKLEDLYNIEFEDEFLNVTSFSKVEDIVYYIMKNLI